MNYDIKLINTYVNPLTPAVELVTGKSQESDFTENKSRSSSAIELGISLIPGGRIEGAAAKALDKAAILETNKAAGKAFEKEAVTAAEKNSK